MKKLILSGLIGTFGVACVHAEETNRLAADYQAMTIAEAVAKAGDAVEPTATTGMATNKPAWESAITLGATLTRGNSDTLLANTTFNTHRNHPTDEFIFGADASYGENNSVKDAETLHGFGQYNHLFTPRWFGYMRADGLHDGIADIKYRVTLSPGAGYYFIKSKATTLAGEVGPGVVFEKLDGENQGYLTPRIAERFAHKMDDHTRIWQSLEFLPQVDNPDNFLANAEIGVEAALTKKLSLRTVMDDCYANIPAPEREHNDLKLISGIAYKF